MLDGIQIKALAAVAIFAGLAFGVWRFAIYHEEVGYQRAVAVYETRLAKAAKESLDKERALQARVDEAERKGAEREKRHKAELSVMESRARRLRDDIAEFRARLPEAAGAACVEAADTIADIYAECIGAYQSMAQAADGHANDARTCAEAWPK